MPQDAFAAAQAHTVRYLELLSRVVAHVDAHLADPLDGDTLAGVAAMSRFHFQRVFRAYFGTTVAGYVTWRRLQRACELLSENPASVLDVALQVGYESSQALAKAMRRELNTTPVAVRVGDRPHWQQLFERRSGSTTLDDTTAAPLQPRLVDVTALSAITATGRGMTQGDMTPAAEQGFGELLPALKAAGLMDRARSWISLFPDELQGPDDKQARMLCGAVFDHDLVNREGLVAEPSITLHGTLAWWRLPAGRYAVFTHRGSHRLLHRVWTCVYRD